MKQLRKIEVSDQNPHLLATDDGKPFLVLGDTAWELFHRLDLAEIERYFQVRAHQGFNFVWANLLPEFDGLRVPNRQGDLPLHDANPALPNEQYFAFVDEVLDLAASYDIYVGLLPAWGDKLTAPWGAGPRIFGLDNLDVAEEYARWLGNRYADRTNIMWVLGGDRPAKVFGDPDQFPMKNALEAGLPADIDWTPIWRAMARGLKSGGANQPVTYHPQGGTVSSSQFLHEEPWLDINAIQSGHGGGHDVPIWDSISRDYHMSPPKPTLDAEPNYEDSPVSPWPTWDPATGFFDDLDVRKQIYRSIFAGGCGVIYGNHCVWQFASDLYDPVLEVLFDWRTALHRPGAESLRYLASLLGKLDLLKSTPDQSRIVGDPGTGSARAQAIRTEDVTLVYIPDGRAIEIDLDWAGAEPVIMQEFDPSNGSSADLPKPIKGQASVTVAAYAARRDRVVVIQKRTSVAQLL